MPNYLSPGVYTEEIRVVAKTIEGVSTSTAVFVGVAEKGDMNRPVPVNGWEEFARIFGGPTHQLPYLAPAVEGFFINGGKHCWVIRVPDGATDGDFVGTDGEPGRRTGLQLLRNLTDVHIICVPGITSGPVQQAVIALCEDLGDRFAILDTPRDAGMDAVKSHRARLTSAQGFAAIYYPWLVVKSGSAEEIVPPSGHMAGIYVRTDSERGVQKAPANEVVHGIVRMATTISDGEQDVLTPVGINCIRSFPRRGIRVWGARTIADDPEWKYVNVRRLFIYLEASISRGLTWVVFEPNDERLWANVLATVSDFLTQAWHDGLLIGAKSQEAFFVKCDRSTMTQNDLDRGRLVCLVGVAPIRPADFIVFRIALQTAGP